MIARVAILFAVLAAAHADTLILKDGTNVKGRWWSLDANEIHFLVNNQLEHYPRSSVSAVTFGDATLPPLPSASPTPSKTATPSAASSVPTADQPQRAVQQAQAPPTLNRPAPTFGRSAPPTLRQPPTLQKQQPAAESSPSANSSEPQQVGVVYFKQPSGDLIPLEHNQAVERRRGSTQYWELPTARSPVRVKSAPDLIFVVRLPDNADPHAYSLYPLVTANNTRRTEPQPGRLPGPVTLPFDIKKLTGSTYEFSIADLATGEYSFSPSTSNDGYCFGVDASPGR
jgi:hypothetical protein